MPLTRHAIEYRHQGKVYLLPIMAADHDDAMRRIASAYHNGEPLKRVGGIG